ncbi:MULTISPECIES: RHS repeat-associated core domain-containing protein [unclassified Pseudomonas]|uniref:RHS repeat-associated core domain-containing protein n=1 Tax=unclassified Pseudomonas TaxID=196821 RepID=UPI00135ADDFC|nr:MULTISPECIES: RHS repeat-associated core domain-containing protein [unclassified Pseudomonas]
MGTQQLVILCSYGYDPLDRLISQRQPDASAHQRFYCKSRLATEIQGAIGFSVFQNNDLLLAQHKNQGGAVESTLLATDQQRSVLHTFTADQQQHPIAYSPYGHRQAESGLTSLLGFNGERPDPVTGHYLLGNGYRAFNPVLMRFNSPDKWSPFGEGGLNTYSYCLGDPINRNDATGRAPGHTPAKYPPTPSNPNRYSFEEADKVFFEHTFARMSSKDHLRTLSGGRRLTFREKLTLEVHNSNPGLIYPKTEPDSLFSQAGRQFTGKELVELQKAKELPKNLVLKFDRLHGDVNYIKHRYPAGRFAPGDASARESELLNGKVPGVIPARAATIRTKQIELFRKGEITDGESALFHDRYIEKYKKTIREYHEL